MAVKIRLKRTGMPKQPCYRIVVSDSRNPRDGATIANLGFYTPYKPNKPLEIDLVSYEEWIARGAKPTDAVRKLANQYKIRGGTIEPGVEAVKPKVESAPAQIEETPVESEPTAEDSATERTDTE